MQIVPVIVEESAEYLPGFNTFSMSLEQDESETIWFPVLGMSDTGTLKIISDYIKPETRKIPGVGYVSPQTDDPVVVATVEDIESVGVIAGAMIGAALGNKNTYLVKRGTVCNVLPGSVIFSATAFMNGNVIDLAVPFENKTRILR